MRPNEPELGLACHVCGQVASNDDDDGHKLAPGRGSLAKFSCGSQSLAATGMKLRSVSGEVD